MPRPMRESGVKMNFDAMTDTITNVAGLMIRLVVLVLLITSPKKLLDLTQTGTDRLNQSQPVRKSLVPLLAQIEQLKAAIGEIQGQTVKLQEQIIPLQQRWSNCARRRKAEPFDRDAHRSTAQRPSAVPGQPPPGARSSFRPRRTAMNAKSCLASAPSAVRLLLVIAAGLALVMSLAAALCVCSTRRGATAAGHGRRERPTGGRRTSVRYPADPQRIAGPRQPVAQGAARSDPTHHRRPGGPCS